MTLILAKAAFRREPMPNRIRHLDAVAAAIQRDPRSSGG
jgi:hypothetical protein